jgi:hypothetical protein
MDTTSSDEMWEYQKNLAALLALAMPVQSNCDSPCCNKFMLIAYGPDYSMQVIKLLFESSL